MFTVDFQPLVNRVWMIQDRSVGDGEVGWIWDPAKMSVLNYLGSRSPDSNIKRGLPFSRP